MVKAREDSLSLEKSLLCLLWLLELTKKPKVSHEKYCMKKILLQILVFKIQNQVKTEVFAWIDPLKWNKFLFHFYLVSFQIFCF